MLFVKPSTLDFELKIIHNNCTSADLKVKSQMRENREKSVFKKKKKVH